MNKYSKKILKLLNKNFPKKYSNGELISIFKIDINVSSDIFNELIKEELVEQEQYLEEHGIYTVRKHRYSSNLKGLEYFKNNRVNNLKLILNSIICPIVVSAITTLITIWLSKLFGAK